MIRIIRFLFVASIFVTPLRAIVAQTATVADLMPLDLGRYVEYNQYDTANTGSTPTKSKASYTVLNSNLNFQGASGVFEVLDSIGGGNPSGIHHLHYKFTSDGDMQVFGDTALLADILPATLTAGISAPPNRWLDKYKMSLGEGVIYQIDTINTTITSGSETATVKIYLSGEYSGIETVNVNGTVISNAYRFEQFGKIVISVFGSTIGTLNIDESDWLVKGIGEFKTSTPLDSIYIALASTSEAAGGREKDYTAYGVNSSGVTMKSSPQPGVIIYPDPASDAVTISLPKPSKQILLYASDGLMIRSFDISGNGSEALLWINDLPNGYYIARVKYADGSTGSASMVVKH